MWITFEHPSSPCSRACLTVLAHCTQRPWRRHPANGTKQEAVTFALLLAGRLHNCLLLAAYDDALLACHCSCWCGRMPPSIQSSEAFQPAHSM